MRRVHSKDTAPELAIRHKLFSLGYRYRLHRRDLPGCPDIVFPVRKKIIFVHGCFWHGHTCSRGARTPKKNRGYWVRKIARNIQRDGEQLNELRVMGWDVLTVWECELREHRKLTSRLIKFLGAPR